MQLSINGKTHHYPQAPTVAQILAQLGLAEKRVAVEVNREIVPRSQHPQHVLKADDQVEIVHAIGGG